MTFAIEKAMKMTRQIPKSLILILAGILSLLLLSCKDSSHSKINNSAHEKPQSGVILDGGADPSGGGGGTGSSEKQLEKALEVAFLELPALFHRLEFWANREGNLSVFPFLRVINECGEKNSCYSDFKKAILEIQNSFNLNSTLVEGSCPANLTNHEITDMSITLNIELCISKKLKRYPPQSLKYEVLALLAHEVIHAVRGEKFDESEAQAIQDFLIHRPTILFLDRSGHLQFRAASQLMSLGFATLAHHLSKSTDPIFSCLIAKKFEEDLVDYITNEGIPSYPVDEMSESYFVRKLPALFDWCQRLNSQTTFAERQVFIKKLQDDFDNIIESISQKQRYVEGSHLWSFTKQKFPPPALDHNYFQITQLTKSHLENDETKNFNGLQCQMKNAKDEVVGKEFTLFRTHLGYYSDSFYGILIDEQNFQVESMLLDTKELLKGLNLEEEDHFSQSIHVLLQRRVDDFKNILLQFQFTFGGPVEEIKILEHELNTHNFVVLDALSPSTEAKLRIKIKTEDEIKSVDFRIQCELM